MPSGRNFSTVQTRKRCLNRYDTIMITSGKNYLCIGPLTATVHVADIFEWATDRFTKVMYQSIHDECRYLDTRVFTLKELLKEDIPKSTAWFVIRMRADIMYAVLTEIRVTEGTIISYYEWEDLLKEIRLSEIPEVRKHPVVECMTW